MTRDEEGHRVYKIKHLVVTDVLTDGPAQALTTPGLPVPGDVWIVGTDVDVWAWCRQEATVTPHQGKEGEPGYHWAVEQTFSTKPTKRCYESQFNNPLMEPQKVSGSFVRYTEEGQLDKDGVPMVNSAFERIRGPQNEWDNSRPQIVIEQNVPLLQLELLVALRDTVNDSLLWGLPSRTIKLSDIKWSRQMFGMCYFYYTRTFTFDVNYDTWDRRVLDEGTKALRGKWQTDPASASFKQYVLDPDIADNPQAYLNPVNFVRYRDFHGEPGRVILNGYGRPWDTGTVPVGTSVGTGTGDDTVAGTRLLQKYSEADFTLLGIPLYF
jgi:hypothetical protein